MRGLARSIQHYAIGLLHQDQVIAEFEEGT